MVLCFFFNDPAPTDIYTLSLHDALPILCDVVAGFSRTSWRARQHIRCITTRLMRIAQIAPLIERVPPLLYGGTEDRKSTRLNSSHSQISYAVFCLKKKTKPKTKPNDSIT